MATYIQVAFASSPVYCRSLWKMLYIGMDIFGMIVSESSFSAVWNWCQSVQSGILENTPDSIPIQI